MKKKVLFLINTLKGGGAEKVLVDIVNNLDSSKFDITLQTLIDIGVYQTKLKPDIKYKSIYKGTNNFLYKIYRSICIRIICFKKNLKRFYNRKIKDNYDIEIAFLEGIPTKILSFSTNKNKFAWVHTDLQNYYEGQLNVYRRLEYNISAYKKFKKIIVVSNSAKDGFINRFGTFDNIFVQYNPLDENNILELSKEKITEISLNQKFRIISVGRLVKQKGYDRLLCAHKRLVDEGFNYELLLLGEGIERENLENFIKENELINNVKLLGFQSNPYKFIKNADLFICSSRAEGFSLVVVESLILGIPTVSTDCSGPNEILDDSEYGLIVDNSTDGIYNGLKKLLNNQELLYNYKQMAVERGKEYKLSNRILEIEKLILED